MDYVVVKLIAPKGACHLGNGLLNVPDDFQLRFGFSRAANFPADAAMRMDDDHPRDIKLTDALDNVARLLIVSARFRELLETTPGALVENEILPLKIINHKGREEAAPYVIVSQLNHTACLKDDECVGRRSTIAPEQFASLKKMVLDESKIDPKRMLFRAAQYPTIQLMRRALADKIVAAKMTGISFVEVEKYKTM